MYSWESHRCCQPPLCDMTRLVLVPQCAPGQALLRGHPQGRACISQPNPLALPCRALYERDARRPFCPPALWLEPYHHLVSAGSGAAPKHMSGAAVVRALVAATDGDAGGSPRPGLPSAARGAAGAADAAGVAQGAALASRPAAVAAILSAAPQCVPFDERVAAFRALIEQDQERWVDGNSVLQDSVDVAF